MSPRPVNKQVLVSMKPTELTAFSLIMELEGRSLWDLSSALCFELFNFIEHTCILLVGASW